MTAAAAPAHRAPRTTEQATVLLDRVAHIDGETATIEANREAALSATNAVADALALPLVEERARLVALLEPWWAKAGQQLTGGKRKSVTLGGCVIGTKAERARLVHGFASDDAAVTALQAHRWAKPLLRIKTSLDRVETLKALAGKHAAALLALGFGKAQGEAFFVERVSQPGVVSETSG